MDHTPLLESSWFDPKRRIIAPVNTTVYFYKHSAFPHGIIQPSTLPDRHIKQPERTHFKNCSAAIFDTRQLDDPAVWIVIPCDKPHDATFVCQSNNETALLKSDPSNVTCESGWFGIKGSPQCFILLETFPKMYFYEAVNMCLLMNSSILTIDAVPRTVNLPYERKRLLQQLSEQVHMKHSKTSLNHIPEYLRDTQFMANVFVGMAAKHEAKLLNILYITFFHKLLLEALNNYITVFADVHTRCGIIQYSPHTRFFGTSEHSTILATGWGAKYRFCSEIIQADTLVCVRPVEAYNIVCKAEHFQCSDKTCVLGIYVCDIVNDCLDGGDEKGCFDVTGEIIAFSLRNSSLYLPCPLHHNCQNNSDTLHSPVKLHAICDGILSDKLLLDETILCGRRDMVHIDLLELISIDDPDHFAKKERYHYEDHFAALDQEYHFLNARLEHNVYNGTRQIENPQPVNMKRYALQCDQPQRKKTIDRICKINAHDKQCAFSGRHELCQFVTCPGMFKCQDFYCLSMSSVCDGQIDCQYGEDEMSCFNLTCPGSMKCRGENRCVGLEEVCNGKVDCIFSYDDEISCSKCRDNCLCEGYILHCDVHNTLNNEHFSGLPYAKALVLDGVQNEIIMDYFYKSAIIFLNVSFCGVRQISIQTISHIKQHLLFIDFSYNKLNDIHFLSIYIFRKLVVIDLSHNFITDIFLTYSLKHLQVVDVGHNPLIYLHVDDKLGFVNLIYMNSISPDVKLDILASANPYAALEVMVSDSILCCMLNELKCTSSTPKKQCYGIMESIASEVIFYVLVFLTSVMVLAVIIKHVLVFSKSRSKLYYNISQLNYITASLISALCFLALASVDIANIRQWKWKTNPMCLLVNAFISMSLAPMSIFKILALLIIQMKIIFPFKHQCRWLKGTGLCCILTWLCMVVLYGINIIVSHLGNKSHTYDKLCSISDCHTLNVERIMAHFVCFINVIFFLCFFMTMCLTLNVLQNNIKSSMLTTNISLFKLGLKIIVHIISDVIYTSFLLFVIIVKYSDIYSEKLCFAVFIYILPSNVIVSLTLILFLT